jgi:hypothetical protein
MLCADFVLLRVDMPFICTPLIGIKPCDAKQLQQSFQLEKDCIISPLKDIRYHIGTDLRNQPQILMI